MGLYAEGRDLYNVTEGGGGGLRTRIKFLSTNLKDRLITNGAYKWEGL